VEPQPDLTICTISLQPGENLLRLIDSIYQAADPVSIEVIILDLSDGDDRDLIVRFPEVVSYQLPGLKNQAAAYNKGLELANGRYIALIEEEATLTPDYFTKTLTFLDDNPDIGIAGPQIFDTYGNPEPSRRTFLSPLSLLARYTAFANSSQGQRLLDRHLLKDKPASLPGEIDWNCGGSHIIRREVFEEIGGLHEGMELSFMAQDYYLRAKQAGWHNFYCPQGKILHPVPARYHPDLAEKLSPWQIITNATGYFQRKWLSSLRKPK